MNEKIATIKNMVKWFLSDLEKYSLSENAKYLKKWSATLMLLTAINVGVCLVSLIILIIKIMLLIKQLQ